MRALLAGGPYHGQEIEVADGQPIFVTATTPPITDLFASAPKPPQPPWWKFRERKRWSKLPDPSVVTMPTFNQVQYRLLKLGYGSCVYWYAGEALEPPSTETELMHYLLRVVRDADPRTRMNSHWEMGADWFYAIRSKLSIPFVPPTGPQPGDMFMGLEVKVEPGAGAPRIVENKVVV